MNDRVECALHQWPCKTWSDRIISNRWQYACRVRHLPQSSWVVIATNWAPDKVVDLSLSVLPVRPRGRPFLKWDADLSTFSMAMFRCAWFNVNLSSEWLGKKDAYLRWCGVTPIPVKVPHRVPNVSSHRYNVTHVPFSKLTMTIVGS